jgi:hypothetical protein
VKCKRWRGSTLGLLFGSSRRWQSQRFFSRLRPEGSKSRSTFRRVSNERVCGTNSFDIVSRLLDLAAKLLDLLLPAALNLIEHFHSGELVQRYHHTFAEVAAPREMVNDIVG